LREAGGLAPASTLLGMLQRGRGEGVLRLAHVSKDAATEAVGQLIEGDHAAWSWVGPRVGYLADVVDRVSLPLDRLKRAAVRSVGTGELSRASIDAHHLALRTLGVLAAHGNEPAHAWLLDQARSGPAWFHAVEALAAWELDGLGLKLGRHLLAQRTERELDLLISQVGYSEPWITWFEERPDLLAALEQRPMHAPQSRGSKTYPRVRTSLSTHDLMHQAEHRNRVKTAKVLVRRRTEKDRIAIVDSACDGNDDQRWVALQVLKSWRSPALWDLALELVHEDTERWLRSKAHDYLTALPGSMLLPHVHNWLAGPKELRLLAQRALELHATPEHLPVLRPALCEAIRTRDDMRGSFAAEALGTAGDPTALPDVLAFYEETTYGYGRKLAAEALMKLDPGAAATKAVAWLFDAEWTIVSLALDTVDPSEAHTREALQDLASRPFVEESLRERAASLITEFEASS